MKKQTNVRAQILVWLEFLILPTHGKQAWVQNRHLHENLHLWISHHKLCLVGGYRAPNTLAASGYLKALNPGRMSVEDIHIYWFLSLPRAPESQQQNLQCFPRGQEQILANLVWLLTSCFTVCFFTISQSEGENLSASGISHQCYRSIQPWSSHTTNSL